MYICYVYVYIRASVQTSYPMNCMTLITVCCHILSVMHFFLHFVQLYFPCPTPCLAFLVCLCMHEPALTKRRVFGARPRSGFEVGWHFPNTPAWIYTFPIESTRIYSNSLFFMASHSTGKNDWFFLWLSWFLLWSGKSDRNLKEILINTQWVEWTW